MTTNLQPPPILLIERRGRDLLARVRRYFIDNPREELTHQIILTKFDCNERAARFVVMTLREEGLIESVRVIRNRQAGIAEEKS